MKTSKAVAVLLAQIGLIASAVIFLACLYSNELHLGIDQNVVIKVETRSLGLFVCLMYFMWGRGERWQNEITQTEKPAEQAS